MQNENRAGLSTLPLRTPTLPPATHTNCYLLGEERLLIVDPGSPYDDEVSLLERTLAERRDCGTVLEAIFLTHHHPDHVGGVAAISSAFDLPVFAHPLTLARMSGGYTTRAVEEGEEFEVDRLRSWKALHTPGHAPGHLCLFSESDGLLIAGDMIPGIGTILIDPSEGDMRAYLFHLARLAQLDPSCIYPAHGPSLSKGRQAIETLIAHRLMREERIFEALAAQGGAAQDLAAIVRLAYDDVAPAAIPFAMRSTESHLRKLVDDGRVSRTPEGTWQLRPRAFPET